MGGPPPGPTQGAEFLLAHTGELQLTDQQVVRLAAIARRVDTQRRAMRASVDSMMTARRSAPRDTTRGAPGARRGFGPPNGIAGAPNTAAMTRMREQSRTDLRDAIAVLTPDQQATAWTMVSRRQMTGGNRMGMRGQMRGGMRGPGGMGPQGGAPNGPPNTQRRGMAPRPQGRPGEAPPPAEVPPV